MILSNTSYIRYPSLETNPDKIITFNAIRYSADICEISLIRLLQNLSVLTEKDKVESNDFAIVLLDVWSIINNSVIFKKIICREFKLTGNEEEFKEINKAVKLRDSNQHIDERISEVLSGSNYSVYGSLSWIKYLENDTEFIISTLFSGSFTNKENPGVTISNMENVEYDDVIQRIEFTGVLREGKKGNYTYREERVLISKIISEMIWWITKFDSQLTKENKKISFTNVHQGDLFTQFKGINVQNNSVTNE